MYCTITKILYRIVAMRSAGYLACMLLLRNILKKSQTPVMAAASKFQTHFSELDECVYHFVMNYTRINHADQCDGGPVFRTMWKAL